MFTVFLVIQLIITLAMVGLILLQRSDSDGLSGLGGGGGGGNSLMTGRAAANFLTRATAFLAVLFMLNSLWLTILGNSTMGRTSFADEIVSEVPLVAEEPLTSTVPSADTPVAPDVPAAVEEMVAPEVPAAQTEQQPVETAPAQAAPSVPTPE